MTEKFPDLQNGQVTLLRLEINTGVVLDEDFKSAISSSQKVFSVFDTSNDAIDFANSIIKNRKDIECNIYERDEKFLRRTTTDDL